MTNNDKFLRQTLGADSLLCVGSGMVLLLAAEPLVRAGDLPSSATTPLRMAGLGLVVLAVLLAGLARGDRSAMTRLVPYSAEADALWAVGSIIFAVAVAMNGPARAMVIAQGLVVGAIGAIKLHGLSRITGARAGQDHRDSGVATVS